jgi:hypothetical protein
MAVKRAEVPRKLKLLVNIDLLVAEEDDTTLGNKQGPADDQPDARTSKLARGLQLIFLRVSELAEVDAKDLSADGRCQVADFGGGVEKILL